MRFPRSVRLCRNRLRRDDCCPEPRLGALLRRACGSGLAGTRCPATGSPARIYRDSPGRNSMLRVGSLLKIAALLTASICFAADAQAQTTPVTFSLDFRALGRHAAWYVALEKGYYKDAGLDVTIIPSQGTAQAIQSVESKAAQFAFSDVAGLVAPPPHSQNTPQKVAGGFHKAPAPAFSLPPGAHVPHPP